MSSPIARIVPIHREGSWYERMVRDGQGSPGQARAAHREGFDARLVSASVDGVELLDIGDDVIERACALTGELKSLDAIHLATATLLDDPRDPITVLTHDARLADAARARGLAVVDPLAA